jgi:hypothetical protein
MFRNPELAKHEIERIDEQINSRHGNSKGFQARIRNRPKTAEGN